MKKFIALCTTLIFVAAFFVFGSINALASEVIYEELPNHNRQNAIWVPNDIDIRGRITHAFDAGWFQFGPWDEPTFMSFRLTDIPENTDYDIYLYDSAGRMLLSSTNRRNRNEEINFTVPANQWVFIEVRGFSGFSVSEFYTLRANTVALYAPIPDVFESNDTFATARLVSARTE